MCTVTFLARKKGFALGMNRDEKRTRAVARPPVIQSRAGHRSLYPSEPGGGTWIGVNDDGVGLALINWYAIGREVAGRTVSRGEVVRTVLPGGTTKEVATSLGELALERVNPFRLIGFFSAREEIVEWRWNLEKLEALRHQWKTGTWISSGFDEAGAQESRARAFLDACRHASIGRLIWLRRLHRSHQPARGPYSTCMHRAEAASVSYTEIVVAPTQITMRYHAGAPCQKAKDTVLKLARVGGDLRKGLSAQA